MKIKKTVSSGSSPRVGIESPTLVEIDEARVYHRDPPPHLLADGGPGLDVAAQDDHV